MYHAHRVPQVHRRDRQQPPRRICPEVAAWVHRGLHAANQDAAVDLIDLQQIALSFLDEPVMAARGQYEHAHTLRWSELVQSYDAFVFVFPQYNWGYPAVLKNALDFLYREWADKPAALVTYGTRGGGLAAAQLSQVLEGLHMRVAASRVELRTAGVTFTDEGRFADIDEAFTDYLDSLIALGDELKQLASAPR